MESSNIVKILTIPVIESTSELEKTVEAKNMFSNTVNAMYATSYKWERLSENGTSTDMRINNETMWYAEQNEGTYQYRCTVTGTGGSVISEIFVVHVEDNSKQISVVVPTKVVFDIDTQYRWSWIYRCRNGFLFPIPAGVTWKYP